MLLTCFVVFSQHLTYSTFMKAVKIETGVSDLNDLMDTFGYNYGGIYVYDKGTQDEIQTAYWVKNCHLVQSNGDIEWTTGIDRSYLALEYKPEAVVNYWFRYSFHNKSAYKTFINTAKQNGFKFRRDGVDKTFIFTIYERQKKANNYKEYMKFIEYTDLRYSVTYWKEVL